jgi:hypothetical protein
MDSVVSIALAPMVRKDASWECHHWRSDSSGHRGVPAAGIFPLSNGCSVNEFFTASEIKTIIAAHSFGFLDCWPINEVICILDLSRSLLLASRYCTSPTHTHTHTHARCGQSSALIVHSYAFIPWRVYSSLNIAAEWQWRKIQDERWLLFVVSEKKDRINVRVGRGRLPLNSTDLNHSPQTKSNQSKIELHECGKREQPRRRDNE